MTYSEFCVKHRTLKTKKKALSELTKEEVLHMIAEETKASPGIKAAIVTGLTQLWEEAQKEYNNK